MNNYNTFYAIQKKLKEVGHDIEKEVLVDQYTSNRTESLKEMTPFEYKEMIKDLSALLKKGEREDWQASAENKMRRKIIAIFKHQMSYTMDQIDEWCKVYGKFNKPLNDHKHHELVQLVTQAESVYKSYVKSIAR